MPTSNNDGNSSGGGLSLLGPLVLFVPLCLGRGLWVGGHLATVTKIATKSVVLVFSRCDAWRIAKHSDVCTCDEVFVNQGQAISYMSASCAGLCTCSGLV